MGEIQAKRIIIYGVCGSGKSTFAAALSERIGIPWHSVDDLTWNPNWTEVPLDEQRARISQICQGEEWILDTAYAKWREVAFERAELIIGLDYSRVLTFARLFRRSVKRAVDKKPICNGNTESWRVLLSRKSILVWHMQSFASKRSRIRKWQSDSGYLEVIAFRHPVEAERWLERLNLPPPSLAIRCAHYPSAGSSTSLKDKPK